LASAGRAGGRAADTGGTEAAGVFPSPLLAGAGVCCAVVAAPPERNPKEEKAKEEAEEEEEAAGGGAFTSSMLSLDTISSP